MIVCEFLDGNCRASGVLIYLKLCFSALRIKEIQLC